MPITYTQDIWKTDAVDLQHINPSIMEGERGITSMLGRGSALRIVRYAPVYVSQPIITGSPSIPSTLTCHPGVIDASPQPEIEFQWLADEVAIPGATASTFITDEDDDGVVFSCATEATNFLGSAYGTSNTITASLIQPMNLFEFDVLAVTGLGATDTLTTMTTNVFAISGLSHADQISLYQHELYAIWQPTYVEDLPITNASAELGDTTGWTITGVGVSAVTSANGAGTILHSADPYFFRPTDAGTSSWMEQIVTVHADHHADIDAGILIARFQYWIDGHNGLDKLHGTLEYLDGSDVVISGYTMGPNSLAHLSSWQMIYSGMNYIPVGTRKMRMYFWFEHDNSFVKNEIYVDDIAIKLYRDD